MSNPAPADDDGGSCCGDMQLGCLVSMNCIAPLFPPAGGADELPKQLVSRTYSVAAARSTAAFVPEPEPPPPQIDS